MHVRSPQAAELADLCRGAGATVRAGSRLATSGNAAVGGGIGAGAYPNDLPDPDAAAAGCSPELDRRASSADPYATPVPAAPVAESAVDRPPDPVAPPPSPEEAGAIDPDVIEVPGWRARTSGSSPPPTVWCFTS